MMMAENALSRFNQLNAARFSSVRWVTLLKARFFHHDRENAAARENKGSPGEGKWPVSCSVITIEGSDQL
jgi:hypothetical protein